MASGANKRVLVIEDEQDIREVVKLSLEAQPGWDVLTADSGIDGLAKAAAGSLDAILLDVTMPEMDGITVFQRLRTDPATEQIPVVFLTANVQPADRRRYAELGVTGLIAKPFDPVRLAAQLAKALGWITLSEPL